MAATPSSDTQEKPHHARLWLPTPYRQELAYRVSGSGRPVVLIHGLWNTSGLWQQTLEAFSPLYRLYAPDLPGHGQSSPRLPWKLREVAALLAAWMRLLKLPPATVVGHSMGGALAIILAASEPALVNRLVLVNAAGLPMQRPFLRALTRTSLGFANHPTVRYASRYGKSSRLQVLALWQAADEVLACDIRPDLKAIRCPTLILWGMRDLALPVQSAALMHRAIPGSELVLLPGVRHQPMRQVPATFHQILGDFLARWERSTSAAEAPGAD